MSATLRYSPSTLPSWDPKYPFDLVIAYQDNTTREWAVRLYDRLFDQLQDEYDFQTSWWGLAEFSASPVRERAADAAARADMVILSLGTGQALPPHTTSWIDAWLSRKEDRKSALVSLIHAPPLPAPAVWPVRAYLQTVARQARMDFFFHAAESTPDLPISLHAVQERVQKMTPTLAESLRPRFPSPDWGIND